MLDDGAKARAFSPDDRGVPEHCHLFLNASDREIEVDARLSPVDRRMPSRRTGLNPESSISRRYRPVPGSATGDTPSPVETTTRCNFVRVSVAVIVAPGTAAPA